MEILEENLKSTCIISGLTFQQLKHGLPYRFIIIIIIIIIINIIIIIIIIIIFITLNKLCFGMCNSKDHMEMGLQLQVSSNRLVELGIESVTPGLQGEWFIHYGSSIFILFWLSITCPFPNLPCISTIVITTSFPRSICKYS